jgi:hypothetical protein
MLRRPANTHQSSHSELRQRAVLRAAVVCTAAALFVASCGDDDASSNTSDASDITVAATEVQTTSPPATDSPTAAGTEPADVCTDRDSLQASVDDLADVELVADGTDAATVAIDQVKDDLASLKASAGDEVQTQVEAMEAALDGLETSLADLGSEGGVASVTASLETLQDTAGTLLESMGSDGC